MLLLLVFEVVVLPEVVVEPPEVVVAPPEVVVEPPLVFVLLGVNSAITVMLEVISVPVVHVLPFSFHCKNS